MLTHKFHHIVRPGAVSGHPGGGLGVIVRRHILNITFSCRKFNTFDCMEKQFNCESDKIVAYLVYWPSGHITNDVFADFESLLIESQMSSGKKLLFRRFQYLDWSTNSVDANKFRSILNNVGLKNHVNKATHNLGHTLYLAIDSVENPIVKCINAEPQNTISDHMVVNFKNFVDENPKNRAMMNFRNYKSLVVVDFSNHLLTNYEKSLFSNCTHLPNISPMCGNCKTNFFRNDASSYIN